MAVTIYTCPDDALQDAEVALWRAVPVAVAVDFVPHAQIDPDIRPLAPPGAQPRLFGRAVTAQCEPPDFGAVTQALELVGPGDVLVIGAGGRRDFAMIGDILSGVLLGRGGGGVVCDGAVRDAATIARMENFPVFARSVNPRGPTGAERGSVNAAVTIKDTVVRPGDLIIGDDDGLVALSPSDIRAHINAALAKLAREEEWITALESGRSMAETFDLPPPHVVKEAQK